jgi:hypothetical protein
MNVIFHRFLSLVQNQTELVTYKNPVDKGQQINALNVTQTYNKNNFIDAV